LTGADCTLLNAGEVQRFRLAEMDLYVCYGTHDPPAFRGRRHPCGKAHQALAASGHRPTVVKTYGCLGTDRFFSGRRKVKDLTGNYKVPTLILDDGTIVDGSDKIVAWAAANVA
jgi:hypothetical protein